MPAVIDPHLSADGAVDFRTVDSILASLIRPGMTDEEKVLRVFHTIRRMFVHGPVHPSLAFDFHRIMHVLGTGACLSMTTPLHLLYQRLGYESQSWVHNGHHMMQVWYGGVWHCLDPHMNFYCYDRSSPPQIASIQQLQEDPTLARQAVAEGRAGAGFLLCGDSPDWFAGKEGEWYLEAGGQWPALKVEEPFGRLALRPGESYVRTWRPGEHFFKAGWLPRDGTGPIHHCAEADRRDTVNWPLYEPHGWSGRPGGERTYYRAWGVGRLAYRPDFADRNFFAALTHQQNLRTVARRGSTALVQAELTRPAEVIFSIACPYVLTAGELRLSAGDTGQVSAWIRVNDTPAAAAERGCQGLAHDFAPLGWQVGSGGLAARFADEVNGCFEGYLLKVQLAGGAAVTGMELISHFQLNRYSLPHLVPGRNLISVTAHHFGAPLQVRYDWSEGPDWACRRSAQRLFTAAGTWEIEVAGPRYPRMEALMLEVPAG
ncbi:MAG: hypothetical protein HYW07_07145 [Candidatus Latescibacteria bacterium]|nr:hypothetical protein [Candidatus Latescibacterota bacterium]